MLYESPTVRVSTARVTIRDTDYAVKNIAAVSIVKNEPPTGGAGAGLVLGILIVACTFIGMCAQCSENSEGCGGLGTAGILLGLIMIALGVVGLIRARPEYHLVLQTNAGNVDAYMSRDRDEVEEIKGAVNEAIDHQAER